MKSLVVLKSIFLHLFVAVTAAIAFPTFANAQFFAQLEGAAGWQSRNDQRVPGQGGTQFSLADLNNFAWLHLLTLGLKAQF